MNWNLVMQATRTVASVVIMGLFAASLCKSSPEEKAAKAAEKKEKKEKEKKEKAEKEKAEKEKAEKEK